MADHRCPHQPQLSSSLASNRCTVFYRSTVRCWGITASCVQAPFCISLQEQTQYDYHSMNVMLPFAGAYFYNIWQIHLSVFIFSSTLLITLCSRSVKTDLSKPCLFQRLSIQLVTSSSILDLAFSC